MAHRNYMNFITNFALQKFGPRNIRRPLNSQIEVTLRCNAKCKFCEIWRPEYQKSASNIGKEMNTKQVKHVIDELAKNKVLVCCFTGGEPTLRDDIGELIDYTANRGMMATLATNGYYLEELANEGALDNVDIPLVSLDFPNAELHNKYRGLKVFNRAIRGIEKLRDMGKNVMISTVVTKEGLPYMEDMCKISKKLGTTIEILPCENINRAITTKNIGLSNIGMEYIPNIEKWAKKISILRKRYPNLITDEITVRIIKNGGFGRKSKFGLLQKSFSWFVDYVPCYTASSYIFVDYKGDIVSPCKLNPIISKSILKYPLERIYHSKEVIKIQEKKDGFEFCKGCRIGCALSSSMPLHWSTLWKKFVEPAFKGNFL